ncbi:MAG: DUF5606 domain-containing protein [Flavobacteriales bacterium]|nr:DUF5606 domain-containing protein [Flavobacteriales bacterium]
MDLSKIISVAGKSGLFRVVAQARQAVIAESLEDGKRVPIPSSVRVNSLEEISIFTTRDDVPLKGVLEKLHPPVKAPVWATRKGMRTRFGRNWVQVLPEDDRGRIYPSDRAQALQLVRAPAESRRVRTEGRSQGQVRGGRQGCKDRRQEGLQSHEGRRCREKGQCSQTGRWQQSEERRHNAAQKFPTR